MTRTRPNPGSIAATWSGTHVISQPQPDLRLADVVLVDDNDSDVGDPLADNDGEPDQPV